MREKEGATYSLPDILWKPLPGSGWKENGQNWEVERKLWLQLVGSRAGSRNQSKVCMQEELERVKHHCGAWRDGKSSSSNLNALRISRGEQQRILTRHFNYYWSTSWRINSENLPFCTFKKLTPTDDIAALRSKIEQSGKCQRWEMLGATGSTANRSDFACTRGTLLIWKVVMRRHLLKGWYLK